MRGVTDYRRRVDRLLSLRERAADDAKREGDALQAVEAKVGHTAQAQQIVQQIAQTIQQRVHGQVAEVVTRCLAAVFDDPYQFSLRFDRKRGRTEAQMVFQRDGVELEDPLREVGGGVIDVAALALRLACVLLTRPAARRLLILDEPLRNVRGKQNKERVRAMLLELAARTGFQIVLNVDGDAYPEFRLGTVVELE